MMRDGNMARYVEAPMIEITAIYYVSSTPTPNAWRVLLSNR